MYNVFHVNAEPLSVSYVQINCALHLHSSEAVNVFIRTQGRITVTVRTSLICCSCFSICWLFKSAWSILAR